MVKERKFICLCISIFSCSVGVIFGHSAVTYSFSGGRFGDNLLSYCRAKWISYRYDIPLLYVPFKYSDNLVMHAREIHLTQEVADTYKSVVSYAAAETINPYNQVLYVVPFFPESLCERNCVRFPYLFDVDWEEPGFKRELQAMIRPLNEMRRWEFPHDAITVAVHVRVGTGFDILPGQTLDDMTRTQPLKWPPESFYLQAIARVIELFPHSNLYVYIFTDHDDPVQIMEFFRSIIIDSRVTFDCRKKGNTHFNNVLEDFFAFLQFDCLIRPDSNFSLVASKIADYKILIAPLHATQLGGTIVIDEILEETKIAH